MTVKKVKLKQRQRSAVPILGVAGKILCLFIGLLNGSSSALAEQFAVMGEVGFTQFHPETAEQVSHSVTGFRLSVSNCKWFVHIKVDEPGAYDYQEAAYDGTNLYYLASLENAHKARIAQGLPAGKNVATAWIYNRPILHNSLAHQIGIIWLAYASACYFNHITNDLIEPVVSIGVSSGVYNEEHDYKQKGKWRMLGAELSIPAEVVYFEDGLKRPLQPLLSRTKAEMRYPSPYNNGFTNAIYRVLATTNCGKMTVPLIAELATFVPAKDGLRQTDLARINYYRLIATNVNPHISVAEQRPKLPGKTIISDTRFLEKARVFSYFGETEWLTEPEAMQTANFKRSLDATRYSRDYTPPRNSLAVVIGLLFLLGLPLVYFAFRRQYRGTNKQQKES